MQAMKHWDQRIRISSFDLPASFRAFRGLKQKGKISVTPPAAILPIGFIRSDIKLRSDSPRQGSEGAPDVWLEISPLFAAGLQGLEAEQEIIVITWLHLAERDILKVHPRGETSNPLTGVFATRSPHRPNPFGLHRVTIRKIEGNRLRIGPMEAIDGTPVADIKPVLSDSSDA